MPYMLAAFLAFLFTGVLAIRHWLRGRCLNKCDRCPFAESCKEKTAAASRHS